MVRTCMVGPCAFIQSVAIFFASLKDIRSLNDISAREGKNEILHFSEHAPLGGRGDFAGAGKCEPGVQGRRYVPRCVKII